MLSPRLPANPRPSKLVDANGALGRPRLTKVPAPLKEAAENPAEPPKEDLVRESTSQLSAPSLPLRTQSTDSAQKQAGTLGSGRNRLLICVDDDVLDTPRQDHSGPGSFPMRTESDDSAIFGLPVAAAASSSSADIGTELKKDLVLLGPVFKNGRKLSKLETKFDHLEKVMPQFKIDRPMRKTIVKTLKEMDCWSSDEEGGGNRTPGSPGKSSPSSPPKPKDSSPGRPTMRARSTSISNHSDSDPNEEDGDNAFYPSHALVKTGQQAYRAAKVRDLARPNNTREKVPLQKPQQIPESQRLRELHQAQAVEREEARAAVVEKAVEVLVDLRKQRLISEKNFLKSISKEVSVGRRSQAHRFAFGFVSRALQRVRQSTVQKWTKYQERQEQKRKRQNKAAVLIIRCWKAYRFRKLVFSVQSYVRNRKLADYQAEQQDLYEYRLRVAQRRLQEQRGLLLHQKRTSSSALSSSVDREKGPLSPTRARNHGHAPNPPPVVFSPRHDGRSIDEALFAQDGEHKRPDLAPFSTMFYEKIQRVARQHMPLVATQDQLLQSIRQRHEESRERGSALHSPRGARGEGGGAPRDRTLSSSHPLMSSAQGSVQLPSCAETWTSFQERQMWSSADVATPDQFSENRGTEDGPPLWEEMAMVNTSVAEAKSLLKGGAQSSASTHKSAAYVALEKLCGLKEEDIQMHNHRYKSPRSRLRQSFLNSNLLR